MQFTRITIIKIHRPESDNINEELQYVGYSLGLFNERDKDKSCYRIFVILIKALKTKKELTSDDIAALTHLSRGTVIHHLTRLMEAGIVENKKNYYMLSVDTIEELVNLAQKNVEKTFTQLKNIAKNIDRKLELNE
ncbi:MAG: helix-turn-helix domain-containing protein [Candidatus Woesearchaeota archaeon]